MTTHRQVADNLRIWAERLAGSAAGAKAVGAYDDNLLAAARFYPDVPLSAALWSIERARGDAQAWSLNSVVDRLFRHLGNHPDPRRGAIQPRCLPPVG